MRELIRSYQNTVAGEISRFEGHIAQFLGDGVLAYFGWPRAHQDDAERAVRSALAVTAAASRLETRTAATAPTAKNLQTRIGIATGMVVVGDLIGEGSGQGHAAAASITAPSPRSLPCPRPSSPTPWVSSWPPN
jgi:class 3 adenylate cyclase